MTTTTVSVMDPDGEVRGAVQLAFRVFGETGSAYAAVQRFARDGLRIPKRANGGVWASKLVWGRLSLSRILTLLRNPTYAGSYVFGRYQYARSITPEGEVRKNVRAVPMLEWRVHLREHHEGYHITVEEFDQNQRRLANNRNNAQGTVLSGPAREGLALLQGMLLCGTCGRAVIVRYQGNGGIYPTYQCTWRRREGLATKNCLFGRQRRRHSACNHDQIDAELDELSCQRRKAFIALLCPAVIEGDCFGLDPAPVAKRCDEHLNRAACICRWRKRCRGRRFGGHGPQIAHRT